jgi:hypothetical protein
MNQVGEVAQFPVLDRDAAQTFLEYLDPGTNEFTFQTFTDSDQKHKAFQTDPHTKDGSIRLQRR